MVTHSRLHRQLIQHSYFVQRSQIPGQTRTTTNVSQAIGPSANNEKRPSCCAVTNARGIPTTNSVVPASRPTTLIQPAKPIVHAGDIWPYFLLIRSGEVIAVKESLEGRSLILPTLHRGEVFWGLAFFLEHAPMPACLRATQKTELLLWSLEDLRPLFLKDGNLGWELSRLMLQRVQMASDIVEKLAFQPVGGRLARLLMEFAGDPSDKPIARDLTRDEMAARIGSTREVVCRFLHRFSDQGLIEITRTEYSITDRSGLERLAARMWVWRSTSSIVRLINIPRRDAIDPEPFPGE